jgi:hypothetical protein
LETAARGDEHQNCRFGIFPVTDLHVSTRGIWQGESVDFLANRDARTLRANGKRRSAQRGQSQNGE